MWLTVNPVFFAYHHQYQCLVFNSLTDSVIGSVKVKSEVIQRSVCHFNNHHKVTIDIV